MIGENGEICMILPENQEFFTKKGWKLWKQQKQMKENILQMYHLKLPILPHSDGSGSYLQRISFISII